MESNHPASNHGDGRASPMGTVRLVTLLCPPLGLLLLWRARAIGLGRKILGTIFVPLYSLLYVAAVIALLMRFTGLEIEWRGGFPPVLTWHKTHPNYAAVETSRRALPQTPPPAAPLIAAEDWPGFRGPNRDGRYDEQPIATNWPADGLRPLWKQPIGGGYASFAIAGGRAFTIEQRRQQEAVTAYDAATGRELWACSYPAFFNEALGGEGPRATPAYSEGKVYSLGALGDLLCLDAATGQAVWKLNILADNVADLLTYGMASSPLVVGDKLIVQAGGRRGQSVAAYDKLTGKPLWKVLDDPAAYSSPMLVQLAGQEQLLIVTAGRAVGLQPADGALLWSTPWKVNQGNRNNAQPVILGPNRFLLSAGYGTGCRAVEISKNDGGFAARSLWQNTSLKNKFTSSVFWQGCVFGLDEDILVCLDAQTGERKWKDGRYGYGQVLLAGGNLIILSGSGELALVRANPDRYEELARFQAIEGKTWNHPALAGGRIFIRNAVQMACFDLRPAGRTPIR
jgi:outer membrane protein assembly factor BamB